MFILGINAYHGDSSACLIKDGEMVSASEEERFRRIKHWAGFPSEAIKSCLEQAGIDIGQVEHIAINSDPKANLIKKIGFTLSKRPEFSLIMDRLKNAKERASVKEELEKAFPAYQCKVTVHQVEHHQCHLASSFLVSPFEKAVVVSVDGFGDFASAAWGVGEGNVIKTDDRVYFPHSLGIFYQALTQYIGFPNYGDEYKVMGLAPYGEPVFLEKLREIVLLQKDGSFKLDLKYFRHHSEKIEYEWDNNSPSVGTLYTSALNDLLGCERKGSDSLDQVHMDLARSIQAMYEEAFFHLLNTLHNKYKIDNLALAGGCAMNSVANGKVYDNTPFKKCYIQSAAGDAGGAIGAAYEVWANLAKSKRTFVMDHSYWGPEYSGEYIENMLSSEQQQLTAEGCVVQRMDDEEELCKKTAQAISEGRVIGWFQGKMEWGPRALGNRSILGDPRRSDMKDILNLKIKRRESFRPFAPSILREVVPDWFETDDDVPFMMKVFKIKHDKQSEIPAVTHADGSGRLQTVNLSTNPRYHKLITAFGGITGVPIVLNTSFNENEPVVCTPDEALNCFLRTKMDVLVINDYYIERT
ncbi:MAG: carbamoyltransferase [Gammaproteobacteria bacterium]|nr:carbamoyltransferase [Gammaproteobacteria bacterium]